MFGIDYLPPCPQDKSVGIGLIACGNITKLHVDAYRRQGFNVVALCDLLPDRIDTRAEVFPEARKFLDYRDLLALDSVKVVDCAMHPEPRYEVLRDCLNAGKHVLSQKPFVIDLAKGEELVALAREKGLLLAVNQNGRWNPSWNYASQAIRKGIIGDVVSIVTEAYWNHNGAARKPEFNRMRHLILYDYAIHWFDIVNVWMGGKQARRIFASITRAADQEAAPPLLAHVAIDYDDAQCTMIFNGNQRNGLEKGAERSFYITGTKGTIRCRFDNTEDAELVLSAGGEEYRPALEGWWHRNGFAGTMGELLCAIEEQRIPWNNAADNLESLRLCFSACASADRNLAIEPNVSVLRPA